MPIETLIGRQNPDGGWPYTGGVSWTEPTVYAVLALLGARERATAERGLSWIRSSARSDGGWAPCAGVDESTWVTGLVALLPPDLLGKARYEGAIRWLIRTAGHESEFSYRLREFLRGESPSPEQKFSGWPWVPGAAAWVGPTSIAMLALRKAAREGASAALGGRLDSGRQFLLSHTCQEGGWNHGAAQALGYAAHPYPETTGMALAALGGVKSPKVDRALAVALQFLAECRSADALNWLRLGLMAHGRMPPDYRPAAVKYRTTPETALELLVETGKENPLLGT
jgi:hypothetical protein